MDKRHQRMLEETLTLPGNDRCADCHAPGPRWASVNLGIFLCVGCASVHRKLGTHKSRVKSVTLDSWTRDQIMAMRNTGNTASNALYNPNELLHPPPTSTGAEDRDSEIEKYIRRKYELGAFKTGGSGTRGPAPTSLNRARERDGRLPAGSVMENRRNPELNDVVVQRPSPVWKERELPALPVGVGGAAPRARPVRSNSSTPLPMPTAPATVGVGAGQAFPSTSTAHFGGGNAGGDMLVNVQGSTSSTLPLQINGYANGARGAGNPFHQMQQQQQQQQLQQLQQQQHQQQQQQVYGASAFAPTPTQHLHAPTAYAQTSYSAPATSTLASFDPLSPQSQYQQLSQPMPSQTQFSFQQSPYSNSVSPSFASNQQFGVSPTPSFQSSFGASPTPSFQSQFGAPPNQFQAQQHFTGPNGYLNPQSQQSQFQQGYTNQGFAQNQWAGNMGNMGMGMAGNAYGTMR